MYPIIPKESKSLQLFFNCKQASIDEVTSKPIASDYTEISLAQNLLDNWGMPEDFEIDVAELLNHPTVKAKLVDAAE